MLTFIVEDVKLFQMRKRIDKKTSNMKKRSNSSNNNNSDTDKVKVKVEKEFQLGAQTNNQFLEWRTTELCSKLNQLNSPLEKMFKSRACQLRTLN